MLTHATIVGSSPTPASDARSAGWRNWQTRGTHNAVVVSAEGYCSRLILCRLPGRGLRAMQANDVGSSPTGCCVLPAVSAAVAQRPRARSIMNDPWIKRRTPAERIVPTREMLGLISQIHSTRHPREGTRGWHFTSASFPPPGASEHRGAPVFQR